MSEQFIIKHIFKLAQMSEDKLENHDDGKGGISRRSRKDDQGRDYVCGCGKKYLSYPALYTHIKTKHDGNQPEGTQKTGTTLNKRQKQKIDEKLLKQIYSWIQIDNLGIMSQLDENAKGSVSVSQRIRRQYIGKDIYEAYNTILKLPTISLTQNSALETVLIVYLLGVGRFVSEQLFIYYATFAKLFRNCYYDHGQEIFNQCFAQKSQTHTFSVENTQLAPIICDFFIRFYINSENKDNSEDFKSVIQCICYDFCKWLYDKKLALIKVDLKVEYSVSRKNIIQAKKKEKKQPNSRNKKVLPGDKDQEENNDEQDIENEMEQQNDNQNQNEDNNAEVAGNAPLTPHEQQQPKKQANNMQQENKQENKESILIKNIEQMNIEKMDEEEIPKNIIQQDNEPREVLNDMQQKQNTLIEEKNQIPEELEKIINNS